MTNENKSLTAQAYNPFTLSRHRLARVIINDIDTTEKMLCNMVTPIELYLTFFDSARLYINAFPIRTARIARTVCKQTEITGTYSIK